MLRTIVLIFICLIMISGCAINSEKDLIVACDEPNTLNANELKQLADNSTLRCPANKKPCNGRCIPVTSNCCGDTACVTNQKCCNGKCIPVTSTCCGDTACVTNQKCCDSKCIPVTSTCK
jgi:hypothetical protein